ncbi:phytanoyl-CoA dioxygenase family protein [Pseudarthrobacter sp. N5]|uniref:phytanoyl-CoA dioxygenase family protein n=1 Tax=Pseudarthrobacter sp. N5 TaxID=3418416 RepID=UPI003CEBB3F6
MVTSNGYVLDASPARLGYLEPVPQTERDNRDALWSRIRRDGYLYLTNHLDPGVVGSFREHYFSKLAGTGLLSPGSDPAIGTNAPGEVDRGLVREILFGDIVPGAAYEALTSHPAIRGWFQWFLDGEVHLHKRKIIRHIRPGEDGIGTATQAHYDLIYLREGSERVLSMWIPLGDCPVEMGGLTYLEGSHHWAMADERERGEKRPAVSMTADLPGLAEEHNSRWLLANYRAGDVMVHSSYMVHAGSDNVDPDNRIRLSTDIRYQRASEPIDWRWQEHWNYNDGL